MKATLEFNLPEEEGEFDTAIKAGSYRGALWAFSQVLRTMIKHGIDPSPMRIETLEVVREQFYACLEEHGVDLDG